ncbi:c2h2 finger domain containing protein [Grosmannia clavigera kw1407]|uniref:C2h2 finger domain containing protein n=1 Tax=Grosmannia clavigera (strain kw1407 / UAMH 11150) TaxID=655863 RepID=F0XM09_GROCL|nr:c2h2 finger domain containing protein [Grosmannia clavigera kw1407]EFX01414.1 c2h2 finger domain containing protein [Grosmannia clavigera kw1407]
MRSGSEDFNSLYPEPPQGVFPSPSLTMNHHMSPDGFFRRQDCYPTNTVAYNHPGATLYTDAPFHPSMFGDRLSPTMYADDQDVHLSSSSLSTTSGASAPSSAVGSPRSNHDHPPTITEWPAPHCLSVSPGIVGHNDFFVPSEYSYPTSNMEEFAQFEFAHGKPSYVPDPSVLHPEVRHMGIPTYDAFAPHTHQTAYTVSPEHSPELKAGSVSPYPNSTSTYPHFSSPFLAPTPMEVQSRRGSRSSFSGFPSEPQLSDGEGKEKQRCPHPDCGRRYKDLRAHMLTHQNERPEKCPIQTCEYHVKGFARKYDKNRHTLTHYKGTMVCGFCPGSGSPAEKSFNRADVFKRHLTAVHGVEQTPPNSRKKTTPGGNVAQKLTMYAPDATGKCSTCSQTFSNAQEFYEHLDDCVLRIVQQEDPAEAVNASHLAEVENDAELMETLEKNQLPTTPAGVQPVGDGEEDDDMEEEDGDEDASRDDGSFNGPLGSPRKSKGNPVNGVQKSRGMTHSRGGVPFTGKTRSRRSRQNYPSSWGFDKGQMTMRKRVMTVFAGPRRLAKDDMMLSTEHEIRLKLSDGKAYVTDLDVQTMKRAEGFLQSTEEEKGLWVSDDPTEEQTREMQAAQVVASTIM